VRTAPRQKSAPDARYEIAALTKALDILELVGEQPDLALTELAAQSGLTKVTVFRILSNLELRRYVRRDEASGRYRLGIKVMHLAGLLREELDLRATARPFLEALRRESGETVNLAVPVDGRIRYIDILQSSQSLRMAASIGDTDDYHSTALGKAILANESIAFVRDLARTRGLPAKTDRTISSVAGLLGELRTILQDGYAIDDEENETGARCVAAPVFGAAGAVIGAVSISGPATRMAQDRLGELGALVRRSGLQISDLLGYRRGDLRSAGVASSEDLS
jgi:IclR family transcriptional regulator, KDG regulon repressor